MLVKRKKTTKNTQDSIVEKNAYNKFMFILIFSAFKNSGIVCVLVGLGKMYR